jgi:2-phosphosulfolactate phosphatase
VEVHVAFLPEEAGEVRRRVAVVIDVLRATTSMLTLLERGCAEVVIAPTVEAARRYAAEGAPVRTGRGSPLERADRIRTAGEEGGLAPPGFDFGNSPAEFARADVSGNRVVLATTNGTRAFHAVRDAPVLLAACLRNRTAAARAAAAAALRAELDVCIVCAGRQGRFSLDDAYTAGAVAEALRAELADLAPVDATDAVLAARALYRAWPDSVELFRQTAGGRNVVAIGLEEDLLYCAAHDVSDSVPRVGDGLTLLS